MGASFLVTFDIRGGDEASYEMIYQWAHRIGGFRYFRFGDGTWGRLASTTVIVPLDAIDTAAARDLFRKLLTDAGHHPTHISVTPGNTWAAWSEVLQPHQVPEYARRSVPAGV